MLVTATKIAEWANTRDAPGIVAQIDSQACLSECLHYSGGDSRWRLPRPGGCLVVLVVMGTVVAAFAVRVVW